MPILIGLPLCADAPDTASSPTIIAAANARSAFQHTFFIVSSLRGASLRAAAVDSGYLCISSVGMMPQ